MSMSSLHDAAKRHGPSAPMAWLLGTCGSELRGMCPLCFDLTLGTGQKDGYTHMRFKCPYLTMQSMRALLLAWEVERVVRSGPPGHAGQALAIVGANQDVLIALGEGWTWIEREPGATRLIRVTHLDKSCATLSIPRATALEPFGVDPMKS